MRRTKRTTHVVFPYYLWPGPNKPALKWLGKRLEEARKGRTPKMVADSAVASIEEIETIEKGRFHLSLGRLRDIVRLGYRVKLEDLLEECYDVFQAEFNPTGSRVFKRDYYYALCHGKEAGSKPTPLLIGGDPKNYLWAIPLRDLVGQGMATDYLELAPLRKRVTRGQTLENIHSGVEVVHVIHGSVLVNIAPGQTLPAGGRPLEHRNSMHFHSKFRHWIVNNEKSTSALLLIVRSLEP